MKNWVLDTRDSMIWEGITLYRVVLVKKCEHGHIGQKMGWIEKEENLQEDAMVYDNAMIFGNAHVYGNAKVYDAAQVYGEARIYGNAKVYDNAKVYGKAIIGKNTKICDNAEVFGNAIIKGGFINQYLIVTDCKTYGDKTPKQVGGNHYTKMKIEPIKFILENNISFCEGNVIKYVCRYNEKNGVEDLLKAKQYIEFLIKKYEK